MTQNSLPKKFPSRVNVPSWVAGTLLTVSSIGMSPDANILQCQLRGVRHYIESTPSSIRGRRRERFNILARKWREDTKWLSSTNEIAMHQAYQAIIGMGPEAIPLIIDDLRKNSGHWYWALKAISNEDPVPAIDRGAIKRMKLAWLRWAEQRGIVRE